jgi:hypothetical protein
MDEPTPGGDRELDELRARAYGPHPDIDADPAALARLVELEVAHLASVVLVSHTDARGAPVADAAPATVPDAAHVHAVLTLPVTEMLPLTSGERSWRSLWRSATAPRWHRARTLAGSIVIGATLLSAAAWLLGPHPAATLRPVDAEPELFVTELLVSRGMSPDSATLRQFEPYRDTDLWSVEDGSGLRCLIAWDRGHSGRFEFECVPPDAELFVDLGAWPEAGDDFGEWLPDGSIVRFHVRGNFVDAYDYVASGPD